MKRKVTYEYLDYVPKKQRAMSLKESEGYRKVNVGIQTIIPPRHYISPAIAASHRLSLLDFPKVLYMPHIIFFLVLGLSIFIGIGLKYTAYEPDFSVSVRRGLMASAALLIFYSSFYLPDTLLNRPHPILWRIVQGTSCVYLISIVFILFMDLPTAQQVLKYIDPSLSDVQPTLPGCKQLSEAVLGFSVLARTAGWWFKMLIFRDALLCGCISLTYSAIEVTFRLCMGTSTCWINVVMLDFALSSIVGITLGYLTCKYLEMHSQKWFSKKSGSTSGLAKLFEVFHPNVWWNYEWKPFESVNRFLEVVWLLFVTQTSDLNIFFLLTVLRLPESHWLLVTRALFLAFLAMISIKEYYEFINSKYFLANDTTKLAGEFVKRVPKEVIWAWGAIGIVFAIITAVLFARDMLKKKEGQNEKYFNPYNPPVDIEYIK